MNTLTFACLAGLAFVLGACQSMEVALEESKPKPLVSPAATDKIELQDLHSAFYAHMPMVISNHENWPTWIMGRGKVETGPGVESQVKGRWSILLDRLFVDYDAYDSLACQSQPCDYKGERVKETFLLSLEGEKLLLTQVVIKEGRRVPIGKPLTPSCVKVPPKGMPKCYYKVF